MTIRTWIVLLSIVMALDNAACAQGVPLADGSRVSPVSRTTIFVSNIEESLKLYRDILGLKPRRESIILEHPFWSEAVGAPGEGKRTKVVVLNNTGIGSEMVGNIGLFQFIDENDGPPVYKPARVQTGDIALVMVTQDIFGIYEEVEAAGYTIIAAPQSPPPDAVPGMTPEALNEIYEMLFFDRDGVVINLIQSPGNGA